MRRIGGMSVPGVIFYGVLIVCIVAGSFIGDGIGTTIAAIAGALLALTILGTFGLGVAAQDRLDLRGDRRGRELDEEEQRHRRD
jgi:hypothetical protein